MIIKINNINYRYKTFQKSTGLRGTLKDFFSRKYIYKQALRNIDFEVERGKIIGLLGPNGAGKTTLIKLLTGLITPERGNISVLGYFPYKKEKAFLKQIGVVLGQKSQLIWDLPPRDTFATLKVIYEIRDHDYNERLKIFSQLLALDVHLDTPVRNLSLGERMKCEIIAALLHNPQVLFLDEPTIGLDIRSQKAIREFLAKISREEGITILLTSHHLYDIEKLCDKLYIIKEGTFCYQGGVQELIDQCTPKMEINYKTNNLEQIIECEPNNLSEVLKRITSENTLTDIKINKCSLEDAIYAVLDRN